MRTVLVAALAVVAIASCYRAADTSKVEVLPAERHVEKCRDVKMYPPKKPEPKDLWICGTPDGTDDISCIDFDLFMSEYGKTAGKGADLGVGGGVSL